MFGKLFASIYCGSMFGARAIVFAVWGYVIANMRPASRRDPECYVELNPSLLAATFATTVADVLDAIATLEAPDPLSRSSAEEGRRLVCLTESHHAGPMQFRVVNGAKYRAIRDEETRREQNRNAKRAERQRKHVSNVSNVSQGQPKSAQGEGEVEPLEPLSSDVRRTGRKTFAEDSTEVELSALLFSLIRQRNPNHRVPNLQTWARHVDRMIRRDHRDPAEIRRMIEWCQADDFWQNNILSTDTLRRQFDRLVLKSHGGKSNVTKFRPEGLQGVAL